MKKIIVSLSTITVLIFTGCFIDSDTATVRINLGNIPVAKAEKKSVIDRIVMLFVKEAVAMDSGPIPPSNVNKVHLGAFDANSQLIAKKTVIVDMGYPENGIVTFDVPAGIRRKIVVLGEVNGGYIEFYGTSDELNLNGGAVVTVPVPMVVFDQLYFFSAWNPIFEDIATWNNVAGASNYNIYLGSEGLFLESITRTQYEGNGDFQLGVYFGFAERESNRFNFNIYISS